MKKMIAILLMLTLLVSAACAEISGNQIHGGCVTGSGEELYAVLEDGLYLICDGAATRIAEGQVLGAQKGADALYYVVRTENGTDEQYNDLYLDTLYVRSADGTTSVLGEPREYAQISIYDEDFSHMISTTHYSGYSELTYYNGMLYFIGSDFEPGAYVVRCTQWDDQVNPEYPTVYESGNAVYRMDPADGSITKLIGGLGNGEAHMAIANDRIAVASCWINSVFAYDFSNFMLYDMDGNQLRTVQNTNSDRHTFFYTDDTEFTVIIEGIITDGENIYASLSDSEGDFANSTFVNVEDHDNVLFYEANFTNSVLADGTLVYLTSDVKDTFWDAMIDYTLTIHTRNGEQDDMVAYIPQQYATYNMKLNVLDGYIYLSAGMNLIRVPMEGGMPQILKDGAFADNPAFLPDNYGLIDLSAIGSDLYGSDTSEYFLADSNTRLYSREELEQYDSDTLAFMRNEILARHGYPFKKDKYVQYFGSLSWYIRDENFQYSSLNEIEAANVETIKAIEASRK